MTTAPQEPQEAETTPVGCRPGRPEAAAVIWSGEPHRESQPQAGRARLRGVVRALVVACVGSLVFLYWSRVIGTIALSIAIIVGLSALISPNGVYAAIERLVDKLAHATGVALSWVLLIPVFYLVFLPFGLLFRRGRRDSMKRFIDEDCESYWEIREPGDALSTERQF